MKLRPYQADAVDCTWRYIQNREGNPAIVIPTAGGKSLVIAETAKQAVENWGARVGVIAGVKELILQNADKMRRVWPEADIGIYSASVGRKDRFNKVMFLQVQSAANRMSSIGWFDLLLVDEFHMVPVAGEGRYRTLIAAAKKINPHVRVIGYSATPFRLGVGAVCGPDHIFTEIAYEANIGDLIQDGYLCPLISKGGSARADLSGVEVRGGEYVEKSLAAAVDKDDLVNAACDEMLAHAADRHSWIVFAVNVAHAEHVASALAARGVSSAVVHGGTHAGERDRIIAEFQAQRIRALVNVNVLTTGFDAPNIDCVVMLRPTKSVVLYVQMVGRGFRLDPSKDNTLVLDFAGNTLEFGPVDTVKVKRARGTGEAKVQTGQAKECPQCSALLPVGLRQCPDCSYQFSSGDPGHLDRPVDAPVLSSQRERVVRRYEVSAMKYERGQGKAGKPDHLRAIHVCGLRRFTEYVCLEHGGRARAEALRWWVARAGAGNVPRTVGEALPLAWKLPCPVAITVDETEKYPRVIGVELGERPSAAVVANVVEGTPQWLAEKLRAA